MLRERNEAPPRTGQWTEAQLRVLHERYLKPRADGSVETPEDMLWRVARAVAAAETRWGRSEDEVRATAEAFYDLMLERDFLPNSPTLMNAGRDNGLQYSACYVLPVEDSIEGIFDAVKKAAIIHQSGGGTGFAFSRLRARDALVRSTGGRASGPVSFLRVFNAATEAVKQGGTRRGANMGILRVDHPDVEAFIDCKLDGDVANFNISVAVTDAFMDAYAADAEYPLVDHEGNEAGRRSAHAIMDRIVHAAWRTGDPGLIFIDRINASPANPTPDLCRVEASNPCGEQPLYPNEACNLGSLNVAHFIREEPLDPIDWARLGRSIDLAVRMLDDVIEVNPYPLPEIDAMVRANRRIGVGVMGWADLLMALHVPYDSEEAVQLAERLMAFINRQGHEASQRLAEERGPFPYWGRSIYQSERPLRNATVTTVAPTGTISILAGCSSGIEPLFALAFSHVVGERHLRFVNPTFEAVARQRGILGDALLQRVAETGTVRGDADVPEDLQRVLVTAHEVAPEWHVRMQAAFQRHTDNGVSKTVNLPNGATEEEVRQVLLLAWTSGCLGITVFRDGCKAAQVLYRGTAAPAAKRTVPRPRRVEGATYRIESPLGSCYVTVNQDGHGEPFEVFSNVGKAGSDIAADSEAMGRLISVVLRLPSPLTARERVEEVVRQLRGIGGSRHSGFGRQRVRSVPDAIAQALAEHVGIGRAGDEPETWPVAGDLCPECGVATLVYEEGCQKCQSCGYSMC